jgi:predicted TPR repeat methyltransferase
MRPFFLFGGAPFSMTNPIVNPAVLISPVETGYVAYDPGTDKLHSLNPTAALLAELCDGTRSAAEIRQLVTPILPEGKAEEVDHWIENALKAGLLVPQGSQAAGHREFTPKELFTFVKRLKEYGQVRPAYLCAKRVVELEPENWDMWYELGDLCQSVGKRDEARVAYQKYFDIHPDDAEIEHLLIALRDDAPPARASDRTIQQIYKDFAWNYETRMVKDLGYKGPEQLQAAIKSVIGDRSGLAVLDLGCGSGLSGVALKPFAAKMVGVDLSPEMLEIAGKRNIYDALEVGEITAWLVNAKDKFDIVASLDCLIYFGDLREIVGGAAKVLNPGGVMALSTERGDQFPFQLTDTGRFAHHPDHIREAAAEAGLHVGILTEGFLRMEYGSKVTGIFAVLQKKPS